MEKGRQVEKKAYLSSNFPTLEAKLRCKDITVEILSLRILLRKVPSLQFQRRGPRGRRYKLTFHSPNLGPRSLWWKEIRYVHERRGGEFVQVAGFERFFSSRRWCLDAASGPRALEGGLQRRLNGPSLSPFDDATLDSSRAASSPLYKVCAAVELDKQQGSWSGRRACLGVGAGSSDCGEAVAPSNGSGLLVCDVQTLLFVALSSSASRQQIGRKPAGDGRQRGASFLGWCLARQWY